MKRVSASRYWKIGVYILMSGLMLGIYFWYVSCQYAHNAQRASAIQEQPNRAIFLYGDEESKQSHARIGGEFGNTPQDVRSCKPGQLPVLINDLQFLHPGELGRFDTQGRGYLVSFGGVAFYYVSNTTLGYETYHHLIQTNATSDHPILKFIVGRKGATELGHPIIHVESLPLAEAEAWTALYKRSGKQGRN